MAGLAAGLRLIQEGKHVIILEASHKTGGCCATTNQDGFTFCDGAIWMSTRTLLDHAFERLRLDRERLVPMRKITNLLNVNLPRNTVVSFSNGTAGPTISHTRNGEPIGTEAAIRDVQTLLNRWQPATDVLLDDIMHHRFSYTRLLRKAWRHFPKLLNNVANELDRIISDPEIRSALSSSLLFTGLDPRSMPAEQLLGIVTMFADGNYIPEGGMGQIPQALADAFVNSGGELRFDSAVKKINVANGRVQGVTLDDERLEAETVISTTSGMQTYLQILEPSDVPRRFLRWSQRAQLSIKTYFSLQLGLRKKIDAQHHIHLLCPAMREQWRLVNPGNVEDPMLFYTVPTVTVPGLAPPDGSIVEVFVPTIQSIPPDDWDEKRKMEMVETTLKTLNRLHPNVDFLNADEIATFRVRSPREFKTDMRLYQGRMYGLSVATRPGQHFTQNSPIDGLLLAGQTVHPGFGVAPSMMSGIFAADALLG